jgi:dephospho-CoA kinase
LFEAGFTQRVDEIWVVWVPVSIQVDRVLKRDPLSLSEVDLLIQAQYSLEDKVKQANVVIDNSGTWKETEVQLIKELARIKRDCGL